METLVAMTNPANFTLLASSEDSFLPWVLLFASLASFGIAAFLFLGSFKKIRERKADQERQGYTPNAESKKKEANATLKTIILPGAINFAGFVLLASSMMFFGTLSQNAEADELRVQGWLAAEHTEKDFGDDVLDLLKGEPVVDEVSGTSWVLEELGEGSNEYQLVEANQ